MDVAARNLITIPDMAGGAEGAPATDGSPASAKQSFTQVLKNTQEGDVGQNLVPTSDGTGCSEGPPAAADGRTVAGTQQGDTDMCAPAGAVQIGAPALISTEDSQAEAMPADIPNDVLRQLAALLKAALGKTVALSGGGEAVAKTEPPDAQPNRTAEEEHASSGDSVPQSEEQSLIQRLVAAVLAMLSSQQQVTAGLPAESAKLGDPVPQSAAEKLTTALRAIAQEPAASQSQATDNVETIPAQDTDPVTQLAAKLLEHLTAEQQDKANPDLPKSDGLEKAGAHRQQAMAPAQTQAGATVADFDTPPPARVAKDDSNVIAILGVHSGGDESKSDSSARNDATEHRRENDEHPQADHPAPNQRVAETTSRFDVTTAEASGSTSDRTRAEAVRTLPPQQEWTELEANSPHPSIHLEVDPDDVGRVRLHVSLAGDRVYANVITEHAGVRDYLLSEQPRLQGGLSAQGLEIGGFQVAVEQQGRGSDDNGQPSGPSNQNRVPVREHSPADPEATEWMSQSNTGDHWETRSLSLFV